MVLGVDEKEEVPQRGVENKCDITDVNFHSIISLNIISVKKRAKSAASIIISSRSVNSRSIVSRLEQPIRGLKRGCKLE